MNRELIEKLRLMAFESADNDEATMLHEAADALEAKTAPVGEREAFEAEWQRIIIDEANTPEKHKAFVCFSLGAAHQRQQAREVVMPDVSVMARVLSDRAADACNINRDDNWAMYGQEYIDDVQAMLEVARLNKGAGSHE